VLAQALASESRWQSAKVKRASNKPRFGRGAKVRFHLACASVRKRLLLQACQECRDNLTELSGVFPLVVAGRQLLAIGRKAASRRRTPKVAAAAENIRVN